MRGVYLPLAVAACLSLPVMAQSNPPASDPATQAGAAKPQMEKKKVCERVDVEETTGSRLGAAPKKCRIIEVPVKESAGERRKTSGDDGPN